jgi:hypothetical protein
MLLTPISPIGITTQGIQQPPQHRLVNNTDLSPSVSNINIPINLPIIQMKTFKECW